MSFVDAHRGSRTTSPRDLLRWVVAGGDRCRRSRGSHCVFRHRASAERHRRRYRRHDRGTRADQLDPRRRGARRCAGAGDNGRSKAAARNPKRKSPREEMKVEQPPDEAPSLVPIPGRQAAGKTGGTRRRPLRKRHSKSKAARRASRQAGRPVSSGNSSATSVIRPRLSRATSRASCC